MNDTIFIQQENHTIPDLERIYNLKKSMLYDLWSRGEGPRRFKIGQRVYCTREAVLQWLHALEQRASDREAA